MRSSSGRGAARIASGPERGIRPDPGARPEGYWDIFGDLGERLSLRLRVGPFADLCRDRQSATTGTDSSARRHGRSGRLLHRLAVALQAQVLTDGWGWRGCRIPRRAYCRSELVVGRCQGITDSLAPPDAVT